MKSMQGLRKESLKYASNLWGISDARWANIWSNVQPLLNNDPTNLNVETQQFKGLKALLGRPWFKRVWILQEVANARAAIVVCGTHSVSARIFAVMPFLLGIKLDPHCQAVLDILPGASRRESWFHQKRDLRTLLVRFNNSEATDPRDKIFALLGISSDACDARFLQADNSKSEEEVIQCTISFLLSFHKLG